MKTSVMLRLFALALLLLGLALGACGGGEEAPAEGAMIDETVEDTDTGEVEEETEVVEEY